MGMKTRGAGYTFALCMKPYNCVEANEDEYNGEMHMVCSFCDHNKGTNIAYLYDNTSRAPIRRRT